MYDTAVIGQGLLLLMTWENIGWLMIGFMAGIVVGAIPGMTESTFLAVALPFTVYMNVWTAVFFMTGAYVAGEVAGAYPAILMNMPGTPGASATTFEGYALTKKGYPGQAIGVSVASSAAGTALGAIAFMFLGPLFGAFALNFGSPEMFMLGVFGLTAVASLTGDNPIKGLISAALGLLIATTGVDLTNGMPRAHFGFIELYETIPLLPALLGLFGFSELLTLIGRHRIASAGIASYRGLGPPIEGTRIAMRYPGVIAQATVTGMIVGIVPGTGATVASVLSYSQAKQWSKSPQEFGKGTYEGVVATEAANNSVIPGALIPTLTLGVPGSGTTAIFLAAMMLQGIRPGPGFYDNHAAEAYAIGWALMFCSVMTIVFCLPTAGSLARVAYVPTRILVPILAIFCITGVFSSRQFLIDIGIMVVFGLLVMSSSGSVIRLWRSFSVLSWGGSSRKISSAA